MEQNRQNAWRAGYRAETYAALYLMAKGYRVLARRYKTPVGEIDLVVANRHRLAFVEVKARKTSNEALFAVTAKQQQRIRRTADHWLAAQQKVYSGDTGFDVIAIVPWKLPCHFKDVFSHARS